MNDFDDEQATTPRGKTFSEIARGIASLVESKQQQYGDSVGKTGAILSALYPEGVRADQYADLLLVVRMLDKLARLANRNGGDLGGESQYSDLCGYALLGLRKDGG